MKVKIKVKADDIRESRGMVDVVASYINGSVVGQTIYPDGSVVCWDSAPDPGDIDQVVEDAIECERWSAVAEILARAEYSGSGSLAWSSGAYGGDYEVVFDEEVD